MVDGFSNLAGAGEAIGRAVWDGPGPIAVFERDGGRVIAVNDAMAALLGHDRDDRDDRDDLVGRSIRELGFWPDADEQQRMAGLFRGSERLQGVPMRVRRRSGDMREVLASISAAEIEGRACAVLCASDVTEQRRLEAAAAAAERDRLASILEVLPIGVVLQDLDGLVVAVNSAIRDIHGLTPEEIAGRTSRDPQRGAIRPDGSPFPGDEHPPMVTLRTGEPASAVIGVHRPDGSLAWLSVSSRMIDRGGPGGAPAVLSAVADITEVEPSRLDGEAARAAAEEADRVESRFLAVISHEMRTPLTAVMGYSQMLLAESGGPLTPSQRHDLTQIARGADRLLSLIEDLLDLGRIHTGRLAFDFEPVDLAALLKGIEPDLRVQAAAEGLTFWLLAQPGLTVLGDPRRLEQAVFNLVGNAVKFTREGQVRVDAVRDGEHALIIVEDTGVGIPEAELSRIFDLFQQGDATTTRRYGGLGIGLAIARSVIERHGGIISVRSAQGEGSTFTIRLPLAG